MADRVRPEETEIRHADEGLGKVHSIVEDSFEAQLGSGTVFHIESANRILFNRQKDQATFWTVVTNRNYNIKIVYLFLILRSFSLASM